MNNLLIIIVCFIVSIIFSLGSRESTLKFITRFLFATAFTFITLWLGNNNRKQHDYYLDVNKVGYQLIDTKDNRKVATWKWNENPKLDSIIDNDNQ